LRYRGLRCMPDMEKDALLRGCACCDRSSSVPGMLAQSPQAQVDTPKAPVDTTQTPPPPPTLPSFTWQVKAQIRQSLWRPDSVENPVACCNGPPLSAATSAGKAPGGCGPLRGGQAPGEELPLHVCGRGRHPVLQGGGCHRREGCGSRHALLHLRWEVSEVPCALAWCICRFVVARDLNWSSGGTCLCEDT